LGTDHDPVLATRPSKHAAGDLGIDILTIFSPI
jgi:hypothetical protein